MPFHKEYEYTDEGYVARVNRTRTGPPVPPSTGTTVAATGNVVADSADVTIKPSKIIKVTIPGPREPVLNASGIMAPRWRRFFEELYRRTGALEDNVNALTDRDLGGSTSGAIALSGIAPTLIHNRVAASTTGSIAITGELADTDP